MMGDEITRLLSKLKLLVAEASTPELKSCPPDCVSIECAIVPTRKEGAPIAINEMVL
jgi:hypothetical protein